MQKFTEEKLEQAIISLLSEQNITHVCGDDIDRKLTEVLLADDLRKYLSGRYASDGITDSEISSILRELKLLPESDLYGSNKKIMRQISDGFLLKREDHNKKDLYIELIDYSNSDKNIYKIINQLEIRGFETRIPDCVLYINGIPLVVFEFKSAIRENTTLHDAYIQLTNRYRRDIPTLFKYNAFCVISDGANTKMGSFFAPYEFFYAWRKTDGAEVFECDGIKSLYTMIEGLFDKTRLREVIQHFIYFPDTTNKEEKIVCRYPQFYAATKLYENIKEHRRPSGDGRGGTYFGATGSGKSYIMLYLARLLMKSVDFESPTILLITDRTDLDDQLAGLFTNAKTFIGDSTIFSIDSRSQLHESLKNRQSGGVFLTTIQKFSEKASLLSGRSNVICISDEAHRSQVNFDQKVVVTSDGVQRSYGFAKYLHDSLPNATYVGFTGTPIDATLDVFGEVVDSYTMRESVKDEITVDITYEGRAAKVLLDNSKLREIEKYYAQAAEAGASEYQIEESKKANTKLSMILGDPDRVRSLAADFVEHYENRIKENATIAGKALFVSSSRQIAYSLYKEIIALRPEWVEVEFAADGIELSEREKREIKPMERIKLVMTRNQDDDPALYSMLGTKADRKELDRQFKFIKSNFRIAIVVDMWLTGFDVPFLDTMYLDKPIQKHTLIQTISRVNRKAGGKIKGLVVDYIGIKKQMNLALAQYDKTSLGNIEDIQQSVVIVKDHLHLLDKIFHKFDGSKYFDGSPVEQLHTLNMAAEYAQTTYDIERRFMRLVKRMKAAYNICSGDSHSFSDKERDRIHFYLAIRSIIYKLTKGEAPDAAQMNKRVSAMIQEALKSEGIEEILKLSEDQTAKIDVFDDKYLQKIEQIQLPNTKLKLLQRLLSKAIDDFKKVNKIKSIDFSQKLKVLVDKYNKRKEDMLVSEVVEDFTNEIVDLIHNLKEEYHSFKKLGIVVEEKAFYDILKALTVKYNFEYPDDKLVNLAKSVKSLVDSKTRYAAWDKREDIKAELKANLIVLLADHNYPPVDRDEVYKEIFEQVESFKKYRNL
ncbi:MAG: type I restriction endonuclease subunit R [Chloroflexi bacterium]|nr:type I restriction endonuclease subunit R [Chloroflexota bacterium]